MSPGRDALGVFFDKSSSANLQFDALDGLRGVAVLLVVLSHLSNSELFLLPGLDLSGTGKYGVYLFFSLSAFLLTYPLIARGRDALLEGRRWVGYGLRRVLRIFPLYFLVLLVNHALWQAAPGKAFPAMRTDDLVAHLLLQDGKRLYWTIPVEFTYYLVLPFMALLFVAVLRRSLPAGALASALGLGACASLWPGADVPTNSLVLGYYLPVFVLGSLAALTHWRLSEAGGGAASKPWAFEALATAVVVFVVLRVPSVWSAAVSPIPDDRFHHDFLGFGTLWALLLVGVLNGAGLWRRLLSWRPLRLVGVVSFSVYLWHLPIIRTLDATLPGPRSLVGWLALALSLAASVLSYLCIERPFTRSPWIQARVRAVEARGR